jgi:hypothetical protein
MHEGWRVWCKPLIRHMNSAVEANLPIVGGHTA